MKQDQLTAVQNINTDMQQQQAFDPFDEDSWFFGNISRADATLVLMNENSVGSFLIRESTSVKGDLVLSVKENSVDDCKKSCEKVSHYIINKISTDALYSPKKNVPKDLQVVFKIGLQHFRDIPSLLSFHQNLPLDTTPLLRPATCKDPTLKGNTRFSQLHDQSSQVSSSQQDSCISSESLSQSPTNSSSQSSLNTGSLKSHTSNSPLRNSQQRKLPAYAKVIQTCIPNAYDKTALTLKQGDIVRVTKIDISGRWEGEVNKKRGHFPFTHVELIDSNSSPPNSQSSTSSELNQPMSIYIDALIR